ncbi:MAG: competence/damage-inducible protein A [Bacteroidales bacterium]|jgi:nicotinamide-nucleotide amidase|nr:competence/damage-inducible protein A [Bacteroidales bacterium]
MKAEIITIGDELLIGQTIDTNSAWIGAELSLLGFDVQRKISIHDRREDIIQALNDTQGRSDVVLITGGLGPTSDDITKITLCEYFNTRLVPDIMVLSMVEQMMSRRGILMNENNRRQADVPESCRVLSNAAGTAPGMWFEKDGTVFISMPGVPSEMKYIMNQHVIPELKIRFSSQVIIHRNIMTYGAPEAVLAGLLESFEASLPSSVHLAYLPSLGIIKLRLSGTGTNRDEVVNAVEDQVRKLYRTIPELIYGENEETMEMAVGRILRQKSLTLCTAESCTGGNIARMITSVPGSSDYYKGSVVAYDNRVKTTLLGVGSNIIEEEGAVSGPVVRAMAEGARKLLNTDYAVAISGIAGPSGGTTEKPVGTVWIAVSSAMATLAEKFVYGTDRNINIMRFSVAALNMLRQQIISG